MDIWGNCLDCANNVAVSSIQKEVNAVLNIYFQYTRWNTDRESVYLDFDNIKPENIVGKILIGHEEWTQIATYIKAIVRPKKAETQVRWSDQEIISV